MIEPYTNEMKTCFAMCFIAGIAALALLISFYLRKEKAQDMDDWFIIILVGVSCIFFFCSGFFLCEWLETIVDPEFTVTPKTGSIEH